MLTIILFLSLILFPSPVLADEDSLSPLDEDTAVFEEVGESPSDTLTGFYDPETGVLTLNEVNVNNFNVKQEEEEVVEEEEEYISLLSNLDPVPGEVKNLPDYNVVRFAGSFNGTNGYYIFPYSVRDSLFVNSQGVLLNVGTSNVVGRFFASDNFSPTESTSVRLATLLPVFGSNTASTVYRYGYTTYVTTYYTNTGSNLGSTNTYGHFMVSDELRTDVRNTEHDNFLLLLILVLLQGGSFLCYFLKFSR